MADAPKCIYCGHERHEMRGDFAIQGDGTAYHIACREYTPIAKQMLKDSAVRKVVEALRKIADHDQCECGSHLLQGIAEEALAAYDKSV